MADICVFAGQGAQVPGMGMDFAMEDRDAANAFALADRVMGFEISKVCFEGPVEELTKSSICQPAIFTVSYVSHMMLQKRRKTEFAAAAGLSLGEWGALCIAGVLDFESTLKVLEARGKFMQEACEATPSGMIAIIGAGDEDIKEICDRSGCTVANVNSAVQVVLSGSQMEVEAAVRAAKALGIKKAIPLATAGAFHSNYMKSAREKLSPILDTVKFNVPKIPVLSNVTGKPHPSDPGAIKKAMLEQITKPTNWLADVETAKALGGTRFIEFGPGKVLSGLVKKIDPSLVAVNIGDRSSLEAALEILG